ncbi:UV-damaged DNA-binding protein rad7, partial [Coemansia sp. RSA 2603]
MDAYDRARGSANGNSRPRRQAGGNTIKGPHSALTDYLQEIGVSEHFRERRQREAEERERLAREQAAANGNASNNATAAGTANAQSADSALAADLQGEEDEAADVGTSSSARRIRTRSRAGASTTTASVSLIANPEAVTVAVAPDQDDLQAVSEKPKAKRGRKKKKDDSEDEADYREGLNRSSARKGGRMKDCELCGKRFLQRGEHDEGARVLCSMCQRSVDKAHGQQKAVSARARETVAREPVKPKKKMRKTADGLLEYESGPLSLQDLCVRVIAKHLDQVESFGDITAQSLNKLCRIISKMRLLDEHTLGLFLGPDKSSVTLYDCTKINRAGIQRIAEECSQIQSLDLEYCGRLDNSGLMTLGSHLRNMTSLRLDGAFLVKDEGWAELFRQHGPRLKSFRVRFTGFGIDATRALVIHCPNLVELRISECVDFDDDCLALLSAPITDYEEEKQEYERVFRLLADRDKKGKSSVAVHPKDYTGPIPAWQPLSSLIKLDLAYPYKPMASQTTARMIRTLGGQLRVLDLSGFKDIDDSVILGALDENCQNLEELYLNECMGISPEAMCEFFARQRKKAK